MKGDNKPTPFAFAFGRARAGVYASHTQVLNGVKLKVRCSCCQLMSIVAVGVVAVPVVVVAVVALLASRIRSDKSS